MAAWLLALIVLLALGVYINSFYKFLNFSDVLVFADVSGEGLDVSGSEGYADVSREGYADVSREGYADVSGEGFSEEGLGIPDTEFKKLISSLNLRTVGSIEPLSQDNTGYSGPVAAEYNPNQQIIKPHMTPQQVKAHSVMVPADKGTQAESIQDSAVLTPSVRDMIRNDVKKGVKNEYEISY